VALLIPRRKAQLAGLFWGTPEKKKKKKKKKKKTGGGFLKKAELDASSLPSAVQVRPQAQRLNRPHRDLGNPPAAEGGLQRPACPCPPPSRATRSHERTCYQLETALDRFVFGHWGHAAPETRTSTSSAPSGSPWKAHPVCGAREIGKAVAARPGQQHLGKRREATNGPAVDVIRLHRIAPRHWGRCAGAPITVIADRSTACSPARHPEHQAQGSGGSGAYARDRARMRRQTVSAIGSAQGRAQRHARPLSEKAPQPTRSGPSPRSTGLVNSCHPSFEWPEEGEPVGAGPAISWEGIRVGCSPHQQHLLAAAHGNGHCAGGASLSTSGSELLERSSLTASLTCPARWRQGLLGPRRVAAVLSRSKPTLHQVIVARNWASIRPESPTIAFRHVIAGYRHLWRMRCDDPLVAADACSRAHCLEQGVIAALKRM